MNEEIIKLKTEAEEQSKKLAFERMRLLNGEQDIQKRLQQIDVELLKLTGKLEVLNKLLKE